MYLVTPLTHRSYRLSPINHAEVHGQAVRFKAARIQSAGEGGTGGGGGGVKLIH
jgi:hypothetical protein